MAGEVKICFCDIYDLLVHGHGNLVDDFRSQLLQRELLQALVSRLQAPWRSALHMSTRHGSNWQIFLTATGSSCHASCSARRLRGAGGNVECCRNFYEFEIEATITCGVEDSGSRDELRTTHWHPQRQRPVGLVSDLIAPRSWLWMSVFSRSSPAVFITSCCVEKDNNPKFPYLDNR